MKRFVHYGGAWRARAGYDSGRDAVIRDTLLNL
jgi:hypothetical protein